MRGLTSRLLPASMAGRMIGILVVSFAALLAVLTIAEQQQSSDIYATAADAQTASRIQRVADVLSRIRPEQVAEHLRAESLCHFGYELSRMPFPDTKTSARTEAAALRLAKRLAVSPEQLRVGRAMLTPNRFGYSKCRPGAIALPAEGLVISLRLADGRWLHAEVHPHEPHFQLTLADRLQRSGLAFLLAAGIAALFVYRLVKPLRALGEGAARFGAGLRVEPIAETGPPDLRRLIAAFNAMQREVTRTIRQRSTTLAALSHDLRTPLTALRVKAELVEDETLKCELIASIRKMEAIATSTIEFLQGESHAEPVKTVDLTSLVESECADFEDLGADVRFAATGPIPCECRPEALSRAVRNLIDNAVKYGGSAEVCVRRAGDRASISIVDTGPGIPQDRLSDVVEPFVRLCDARDSKAGGSGLGLAVVKAVAEGHDGRLTLTPNEPTGLCATIIVPLSADEHPGTSHVGS